jgi:hypothetical protein
MNQATFDVGACIIMVGFDTNILLLQCLIQYLGSNGYLNFIPDTIYNGFYHHYLWDYLFGKVWL